MNRFAALVDRLAYVADPGEKILLIKNYFGSVSNSDRGYGLAAMTGELNVKHAKPALIRGLAEERLDPVLFDLSHDYVGDLAETVSLLWPAKHGINRDPPLSEIVETLGTTSKSDLPGRITGWLDALDANGRWVLLKLLTGSLRTGVPAQLAKAALAQYGKLNLADVEEIWHGLAPPYEELFAWADGTGPPPKPTISALFRPLMAVKPLEANDLASLDPAEFSAEWAWDGAQVLAAASGGERRLYNDAGDDISQRFPDLIEAMGFDATIDGWLVALRDGEVAPFTDLERRLNRKTVSRKLLTDVPVAMVAHDLLIEAGEDLRDLSFDIRRKRLETWAEQHANAHIRQSPLIDFDSFDKLTRIRNNIEEIGIRGVFLRGESSPYRAGPADSTWFIWKKDPLHMSAVLLYAERGQGRQSSPFVDYTFGIWRDGDLVPVGKAPFTGTDDELARIETFVRDQTQDRFGPVRQVTASPGQGVVFEIAFDGVSHAPRRKSGLVLREPRITRVCWDRLPEEADQLDALTGLLRA